MNGQGPGEPRTSDLVLGIVATAMLAAFCLLMASNLVSGALEVVG
uniref:Protein of unassigned function n=1 Tax=Methylobacterium oryzae CBMB20 TaxID=693986 RepID=A0A088B2Y4_9HYPH|nr:protein of unassigned function [Methylobacterium oryzae CBMB20]